MIAVQDEVQAGKVGIALLVRDSHHAGEVRAVILLGVVLRLLVLAEILHAIDEGRNHRQFGGQIQAVFQGGFPVDILLHAVVLLRKGRTVLQGQHRLREEHHRVRLFRHGLDHLEDIIGNAGALCPFGFHFQGLLFGRHFADHQQVVQAAHQRHLAAARLGQFLEHLRDGHAAEADAFRRVDKGDICQQRLDIAHPADDLSDGDLSPPRLRHVPWPAT